MASEMSSDDVREGPRLFEREHVWPWHDHQVGAGNLPGEPRHPIGWGRHVCGSGDAGRRNPDAAERADKVMISDRAPSTGEGTWVEFEKGRFGIANSGMRRLDGEGERGEPSCEGRTKYPFHPRSLRCRRTLRAHCRVSRGSGAGEHEGVHDAGMAKCEVLGDHRPHRDAHDVERGREAQGRHFVGDRVERQRNLRGKASTKAGRNVLDDSHVWKAQPVPEVPVQANRWQKDEGHRLTVAVRDMPEER